MGLTTARSRVVLGEEVGLSRDQGARMKKNEETGVAMKAFLLGSAAALSACAAAVAADLPVKATPPAAPVATWTGFYLGGQIGGAFGTARKDFVQGTTTGDFDVSGVIGGGTAGYNQQFGSIILGLEGDISGSGVKGNTDCPNRMFTCSVENHWLATVRGRLGYSFDRFMPYVTGGAAGGDVRVFSGLKTTGGGGVDFTRTVAGWTAGAGLETAFDPHWTTKVEYLYVRFDDVNVPSNVGTPTTTKLFENIVRVGVNYRFW